MGRAPHHIAAHPASLPDVHLGADVVHVAVACDTETSAAALVAVSAVFDSIRRALICLDADLRVLHASAAAGRVAGVPASSLIGREVSELLGDELSDLHMGVLSGESHLDNLITHPRVQKPGLAFAGYYPYIKPGRVLFELAYPNEAIAREAMRRAIHKLPMKCRIVKREVGDI